MPLLFKHVFLKIYPMNTRTLLDLCDLVLLDVKFTSEEEYKLYTGGSLSVTLDFLKLCDEKNIPVWIRHVVVPGINDKEKSVISLSELVRPFRCVKKIELLPFKKLCVAKYEALGKPFGLIDTPQMNTDRLNELSLLLNTNRK